MCVDSWAAFYSFRKEREQRFLEQKIPTFIQHQWVALARGRGPVRWLPRRPGPVRLRTAGQSPAHRWAAPRSKRRLGRTRRESRSNSATAKTAWYRGNPCRGDNFPGRDETRDSWRRERAESACPAFGAEVWRGEDPDPRKPL